MLHIKYLPFTSQIRVAVLLRPAHYQDIVNAVFPEVEIMHGKQLSDQDTAHWLFQT